MSSFFSRLFGRKYPPAEPEIPAPAPAPVVRHIPRRVPEALACIPLAEIEVHDAGPAETSFLGFSVNTTTFSPPITEEDYDIFRDYVVVDVETTGLEYYSSEIIEVSALRFENFTPVSLFTALIRPLKAKRVPDVASSVNGITYEALENAVTFQEIRESLQAFIDDSPVIVGHNLPFDVRFLFQSGIRFSASKRYVDTLYNAKNYLGYHGYFTPPRMTSFRLEDLAQFFDIPFDDAHMSAADCLAAGLLLPALLNDMSQYEAPKPAEKRAAPIPGVDFEPTEYISIKSIIPQKAPDPASPLYRKKVAFTGEISIPRQDAMQLAVDAGMKLMSSVTKNTDYLVCGTYLNPDYLSSKRRKADELNSSGEGHIVFLSESEFFALVGAATATK